MSLTLFYAKSTACKFYFAFLRYWVWQNRSIFCHTVRLFPSGTAGSLTSTLYFPEPDRVSLDMMSVQANTGPPWPEKNATAFWRGRDSRQERLQLVKLSRAHPDFIDAAFTNFFFFKHDESLYGPLVKHVSFFDFFKVRVVRVHEDMSSLCNMSWNQLIISLKLLYAKTNCQVKYNFRYRSTQ